LKISWGNFEFTRDRSENDLITGLAKNDDEKTWDFDLDDGDNHYDSV